MSGGVSAASWRPEAALCLRVMPAERRGGRLVAALEAAVSLPSHRLLLGWSARPLRKQASRGIRSRGEVRSPRVPKRSLQARETAPTRPQYGEPSVQADRVGSFGLPRRRGSKKTRGCQGHKRGACGHAPHARHAHATTPARVCGGGRQGWRRSNCRAPYLLSELIAHAHRAFWSRHGVL